MTPKSEIQEEADPQTDSACPAVRRGGRGWSRALVWAVCVSSVWASASHAQQDGPALPDDPLTMDQLIYGLSDGSLTMDSLRRKGLQVFTTPFNTFDGYGDGPFRYELPASEPGRRPTLQGNGLTLRINGLDAQSCNECHTIVRASAVPPVLGIGGVGGIVNNALIMPTLMDVADSTEDRAFFAPGNDPALAMAPDGTADYNGRYANPPFLFGGGGVELLAKEMTRNLQQALREARGAPAGVITPLVTHGIDFGEILSLGSGQVELHVEGIGFENNLGRSPEEVLVVRPFGRKGENFSMRDFDRVAMQFHFGMQPVEVVGEYADEDGDGVVNEVTVAEMSALHVFDVTNPVPFAERLGTQEIAGLTRFQDTGCAECHVPVLKTESRYLPLSFPEVPHDPWRNVYAQIDLVDVGFEPVPEEDGVFVPLFADLKRHDMGPGLKESFSLGEIPDSDFTTARLWGVADTAPYLHDGRATTISQAIDAHGGEAQAARDAFAGLSRGAQAQLIAFLNRLRTPVNPNVELITRSPASEVRRPRETVARLLTNP